MLQDGGIEGCACISFSKSTKITASCLTTSSQRMLEPTKSDTQCPKTKKPQQDGRKGEITIKSNLIPTRCVIHKLEKNTTKVVLLLVVVLLHLWRFIVPHQASQPGNLAKKKKKRKIPGNLALKLSGVWLQDFHRTGGNRDSIVGEHKQNLECTMTWGDGGSSVPTGDWTRPTC